MGKIWMRFGFSIGKSRIDFGKGKKGNTRSCLLFKSSLQFLSSSINTVQGNQGTIPVLIKTESASPEWKVMKIEENFIDYHRENDECDWISYQRKISLIMIDFRRSSNIEEEIWVEESYKSRSKLSIFFIFSSHSPFAKVFGFLSVISEMTQSQLVCGSRLGDGPHKRMRVTVPHFDNSDLIKGYSKTLIGRCMNPSEQDVKALIVMLPKIWKIKDKVIGADLGLGRFQFDFKREEDIEAVLKMQPFHFDYWMISLVRWQPKKTNTYPSDITFWVRILGVPLEFWETPNFQSIGDAIGKTEEVDLDYGRVKVVIDKFQELCFETTVDLSGGEFHDGKEALVSLRYEKLFGYCIHCFSLRHAIGKCTFTMKNPEKKIDPVDNKTRLEDRARSYKGVVINGEVSQQNKEVERKDYYNKGKGKIDELGDHKWYQVVARENKKYNRGNTKREEEGPHYKSSRWESSRKQYALTSCDRSSRNGGKDEMIEEGEFQHKNQPQLLGPAQESTSTILPSAEASQVCSENIGNETGNEIKALEEEPGVGLGDVVMKEYGKHDVLSRIAENDFAGEEFQNLTDGEVEEYQNDQEGEIVLEVGEVCDANAMDSNGEKETLVMLQEGGIMVENEKVSAEGSYEDVTEKKIQVTDDAEKRPGVRRKLLKTLGAGGTTKQRLVKALATPRKRTLIKPGHRHGEDPKHVEEKGASNR